MTVEDGGLAIEIVREYEFDAAHELSWHPGACSRLHGHTYRLEVTVGGNLDGRGVVMDFAELDAVVQAEILDRLDHRYLNEVISNPTAERIAVWIWNILAAAELVPAELRLWETRKSSVRLTPDRMAQSLPHSVPLETAAGEEPE